MLSIAEALQRVKDRISETIPQELIEQLCREAGHHWRNRELGPVVTTHLFLRQILEGNVPVGELRHVIERYLRLVVAVGLEALVGDAQPLPRQWHDGSHLRALRDLDVAREGHGWSGRRVRHGSGCRGGKRVMLPERPPDGLRLGYNRRRCCG